MKRWTLPVTVLLMAGCGSPDVTSGNQGDASTQGKMPDLSASPAPGDGAVMGSSDLAGTPPSDLATTPLPDGATPKVDAGVPPDLAAAVYLDATISQILADNGQGPYRSGALVTLARVVAVTKVDKYISTADMQCRYEIWVQDPACKTPPCGLVVKSYGPAATSTNASDCPSAKTSGTLLANLSDGDNILVKGAVLDDLDTTAPMTVLEHSVIADTITALSNDDTITPMIITDPTVFATFVAHTGSGWARWEGTSVTLAPANALLQVSAIVGGGFQTTPGNTDWGDTFNSNYTPNGVAQYPTQGQTFHSISGVVSARHGGAVMPVHPKDFVP